MDDRLRKVQRRRRRILRVGDRWPPRQRRESVSDRTLMRLTGRIGSKDRPGARPRPGRSPAPSLWARLRRSLAEQEPDDQSRQPRRQHR